jgi:hypothetical protein
VVSVESAVVGGMRKNLYTKLNGSALEFYYSDDFIPGAYFYVGMSGETLEIVYYGDGSNGTVSIVGANLSVGGDVEFLGSVSGLSTTTDGSHSHTASMGTAGEHNHGGSTGSAGSHNHGIMPGHQVRMRNPDTGAEYWATYTAAPDHSHSISSSGSHTHPITINSAGGHSHNVQ